MECYETNHNPLMSLQVCYSYPPNDRAANLWKHKLVLRTSKISILPSKLVFFQPAHFSNILNLIYVLTQREFVP